MSTEAPEAPRPFGGKSPKPLGWRPMIYMDEYLTNLEIDGRTPGYVQVVKIGLTHFGLFADKEGLRHPEEITRGHILRFQVYLNDARKENGEPLSTSYKQQIMKYLHSWLNWLEEVGHIERNPWQRIKIGREPKKPKPLEDDEVEQLFAAHKRMAFAMPPFYYHRREVMLVLLLGWGLRIHELAALDVHDFDMRSDWVVARNKGGGRKTLPLSIEMKQSISRWLQWRGSAALHEEPALLIDSQGKRLSTHMIRKVIVDLGVRAGVTINPHRLRDTFGTKMLDGDVPVERIAKLMGHSNIKQTLAYSRVNDPKLAESHDAVMSPYLQRLLGSDLP